MKLKQQADNFCLLFLAVLFKVAAFPAAFQ
jgi:hypothetical protein